MKNEGVPTAILDTILDVQRTKSTDASKSIQANEPEKAGVVYLINQDGTLTELPKEVAKINRPGFIQKYTDAILSGRGSQMRLRENQIIQFVVRPTPPSQEWMLFKCSIVTNLRRLNRQILLSSRWDGTMMQRPPIIAVSIGEFGTSSLKLVPQEPLKQGEYAFSPNGSNDCFTFGVDKQ